MGNTEDQFMESSMNGAEVIVLDPRAGVIDTTRRPVTGKRRKIMEEYRARLAELDEREKNIRKKPRRGDGKKR